MIHTAVIMAAGLGTRFGKRTPFLMYGIPLCALLFIFIPRIFVFEFLSNSAHFDAVISNPPYIRSDVIPTLSEQVRREPRLALDGGADGLDFYRAILDVYPARLARGGHIILEIGYDQADDIRGLCAAHRLSCEIFRDYGGNDRVAVMQRR